MHHHRSSRGFTLLELALSLAIVSVLLAVLIPALASARVASSRDGCADHLRHLSQGWTLYLDNHDDTFPSVPVQPGWHYGGVRFSSVDGQPFLDPQRPLTPYLAGPESEMLFECPADGGITGATTGVGTGRRTAYRSFGTSYRANAALLDGHQDGGVERPLARESIMTVPSRVVLMGDPIWYEIHESTGRDATWHGTADHGNLLFLDGSVKFMRITPKTRVGPAVYEPKLK